MEFTIKAGSPEKLKSGCIVVGILAGGELSSAARALDEASDGAISAIIGRGDLDDKAGATLMLHALPGLATPRVLLVSLGKRDELSDKAYRDAVAAAARQLAGSVAAEAAFCLAEIELPKRDLAWRLAQAAQILQDSTYRCDELKSKKDESKKGVRKLTFVVKNKAGEQHEQAIRRGEAIAEGMALAKTLGNLPGNVCTFAIPVTPFPPLSIRESIMDKMKKPPCGGFPMRGYPRLLLWLLYHTIKNSYNQEKYWKSTLYGHV